MATKLIRRIGEVFDAGGVTLCVVRAHISHTRRVSCEGCYWDIRYHEPTVSGCDSSYRKYKAGECLASRRAVDENKGDDVMFIEHLSKLNRNMEKE